MKTYKAFISYSHAADGNLAPALQTALHRFARPWYKLRALHIFRDQTNLSANPALWRSIEAALGESEYFLLLASPQAAQSRWIKQEIGWWVSHCPADKMLIVLTDGELEWDAEKQDFDWQRTTALPKDVSGKFEDIPLYVDLRWAKTVDHLSLQYPQFRSAVLDLAAPLHGKPKDELGGEDVRQYRKTWRLVWGVITSLLVLTVGTSVAAYVAFQQRNRAESRALAVHAIQYLDVNPETSLQWATQAMTTALTSEAETALRGSLFASRPQAKIYLSEYRHDNPIWTVAFSTDSQHIIATSAQEGLVKVVSLDTDEEDSLISSVNGSAFTNGDLVLTVRSTGKAELWDVGRGELVRILSENLRDPTHVAFSPDGNLVFTNTGKTSGTIWEINSSNSRELDRSAVQVTQAVFSPDGQFLVTVSENRQAQLWDSYSGHFIRDLPGHTSSYSHDITAVSLVQFSPDGNYIATACGFGASCYLARGQDLDGSGIAAFDGTVRLWKKTTNTFELFYELPGERTDRVYGLAFNRRSDLIATARGDNLAQVWKLPTGELVSAFTNHTNWVWSAAFSPDSYLVITTGSHDYTARLWEPSPRGRELLVLRGHQSFVGGASFSPNGRFVLTIGDDHTARVWKLNTGNLSGQLRDEDLATSASAPARTAPLKLGDLRCPENKRQECWTDRVFSRDQTLVVTFNHQEQSYTTAKVWRANTGELVRSLDVYKDGVRDAIFSNDNAFVVLADAFGNTAEVWKLNTGEKVSLTGHNGRINHVAFSPNDACVVTGSEDGTVRVWQTGTGVMWTVLWGYRQGVAGVTFDRNNRTIVVVGHDKILHTHATDGCASTEDLISLATTYVERSYRWHR